jgi:hypothetical protein
MNTCKPYILALVIVVVALRASANEAPIPLSKALKDNLVALSAIGNGGYREGALHFI